MSRHHGATAGASGTLNDRTVRLAAEPGLSSFTDGDSLDVLEDKTSGLISFPLSPVSVR